ncbi:hypothetical protein V2V90_23930 (plasmid) [Agrobacterium leguminum]|uniref:hypothetical protein n=1 Tax=Agrobacterium leguminum TaxID=2792015 RepID=UPI0030D18182
MTNEPKLSARARQALEILSNGGQIQHRLERNSYTGREQFATRFCTSSRWNSAVKGLGFATRVELENAGFRFKPDHRSSVCTAYTLDHNT